jgi:hypothetical protein
MGFSDRQQRELAEIDALARALNRSVHETLGQVRELRQAQRELRPAPTQGTQASAGESGAPGEPLLAFVHIPKTAGKTVTTMLAAAYSRQAIRDGGNYFRGPERTSRKVATRIRAGARVAVGHVPYGLFREHLPADTRYMTFVREPVDRVLSHYWRHIRRREQHRRSGGRKNAIARADSLEEALVEMRLPHINNLATRFLCGSPAPTGVLPASALDDAKLNLREFAFVGLQERFEESIVLLQRMLGLGSVPYENRHVSSDRPAVEELTDDERELIAECNQLDAELYEFARRLFDEAVADAPPGFGAEVETLRSLRSPARPAGDPAQ